MIVELSDGTKVHCEDEPMGGGASGTTYFSKDKRHVVKIFKSPTRDMRRIMEEVIGTYNCVRDDRYWQQIMSWPDGIVVKPMLGIRMPCAPQGMEKMTWIIFPKLYNRLRPENKNWHNRLLIAVRLSRAVARMHRSGLAHSDLSPNNIMVDAVKGTVNLIDLDGLVVPGFLPPQVLGTPEYIAPEVLSGRAAGPSIATDRHALGVLVYQLLLFRHPFRGPKVYSHDPDEDERLALSETATFIDHPADRSNRPRKAFWPTSLMGATLKQLFEKVFVDGVRDPSARPSASEWEAALVRLADRVVTCHNQSCNERYYPLAEGLRVGCPWCGSAFALGSGVPVLRLLRASRGHGHFEPETDFWIAAYPGKTIHSWHAYAGVEAGPGADVDPLAEIRLQKRDWFLKNLGLEDARVIENNTLGRKINKGEQVQLS
ncbi:MAG: hypothetical protein FJY85_04450, partial [Deltaproteobacteria bacterium]|nr:hypothetical protein [Deltaproteobacteria bacterium]